MSEWNLSLPRKVDFPLHSHVLKLQNLFMSAWGKTHLLAKLFWKINLSRSLWSQHHNLQNQKGCGDEASTRQSLARKSLGYSSHGESPLCWWRWGRECLGLLTLRGPGEPWGWGELRASFTAYCPFPSGPTSSPHQMTAYTIPSR